MKLFLAKPRAQKLSLPPLMKWPGGKRNLATRIVRHFPEHETYVEPFAGGAATFLRKELVEVNVLSDKDPWPILLFEDIRHGKARACAGGIRVSRSLFDRAKRSKNACMKLALSKLSFHGDRATFGPGGGQRRKVGGLQNIRAYEEKFRHVTLRVSGFEKTSRRFDSRRTVHFWDPPWPLDGQDYSEKKYELGRKGQMGKAFDPHHVMKVASSLQGYVFVIYGDHPSVREAYRAARRKHQSWKLYSLRVHGKTGTGATTTRLNLVAIKPPRKKKKR